MKLTAANIARLALPPGVDDRIFFDADLAGFGLRLRLSGKKSWWVQYAIGGRTRKMRLGSLAELDISKARAAAKDVLARVRLGGDPANEKNQARAHANETVGALVKPYLLHYQARVRASSLQQTRAILHNHCKPLYPLPITALDRRTIAARLTEVTQSSGPSMSIRVRSVLSGFCTWAAKEGFIELNPVSFTNKAVEKGPRDRLLTDAELVKIWDALGDGQFGVVLKLLILTGLRKGEIGGLSWPEIDFAAGVITLPPNRTKNGKEHLVPMSPPVRAMIEAQPRREGRDLLFGETAARGFTDWANPKLRLDFELTKLHGAPLPPWVLHDFRRAFSTGLHDQFGVAPHIVETLLGHTGHQSGIAGVYNRSTYLNESAHALNRWADHIMVLTSGKPVEATVVPLRGM